MIKKGLFILLFSLFLTPTAIFCDDSLDDILENSDEIIEFDDFADDTDDLEKLLFGEDFKLPNFETDNDEENQDVNFNKEVSFSSKLKILWALTKMHIKNNPKIYMLASGAFVLVTGAGIFLWLKRGSKKQKAKK